MAGSNDFTGQNIQDTYQRVLQISSSGELADGTGSLVPLLEVTASHAISASHEITKEVSSSYAETASMASDSFIVQGNITASGNISASGNIFGSTGSFDYLESDRIIGHTGDANTGIQFGNDTTIINSNGVQVAKFRATAGTILGHENYRTSISGSEIELSGSITASGNISASGTIIANKLEADQLVSRVGDANTGLQFGSDTVQIEGNDVIIANFTSTQIQLNKPITSNITASGTISGSGRIDATAVHADTNFRLKDSGGTSRHFIAGPEASTVTNNSVQLGNAFFTDGISFINPITSSADISSSGNLHVSSSITFGDGVAQIIGPGNNDYLQLSNDDVSIFINGAEVINVDNDSINLNASNHNIDVKITHDNGVNAFQSDASANRVKLRDFVTIGSGSAPNADPNALYVSGSQFNSSHITASGDISASGTIKSDRFQYGDNSTYIDFNEAGENTIRFAPNGTKAIDISSALIHINPLNTPGMDFRVDGASDNLIIADAELEKVAIGTATGPQNAKLHVEGNLKVTAQITASNNISASGHISSSGASFDGSLTVGAPGGVAGNSVTFHGEGAGNNVSFNLLDNNAFMLTDNTKLGLGNHSSVGTADLEISHNGTDNLIESKTGNLIISASTTSRRIEFVGQISASGNISASGDVTANNYFMKDHIAIAESSDRIAFGFENDTAILIGKSGNPTEIKGDVTASGDISSSGLIFGNEVFVKDVRVRFNDNVLDVANKGINSFGPITGSSHISASGLIQATNGFYAGASARFIETSTNNTQIARNDGGGLTSHQIKATTTNTSDLNVGGNITASGIISSSGDLSVTGKSFFGSHITSSGIISSSGNILTSGDIIALGNISTTASASFQVLEIEDRIVHSADTETRMRFSSDTITFDVGGTSAMLTIAESSQDVVTIGNGNDVDFKVRTANDDNVIFTQGSTDRVGIGTLTPSSKLSVAGDMTVHGNVTSSSIISGSQKVLSHEYHYCYHTTADDFKGDIVRFGTGPAGDVGNLVAGKLYCYQADDHWELADADSSGLATGMLGICVADGTAEFLIKGFAASALYTSLDTAGPIFISATAGGFTATAPASSNQYVRVVGYCTNATSRAIFFDPDKTWVKRS